MTLSKLKIVSRVLTFVGGSIGSFIEKEIDCKIILVGVGPDRKQSFPVDGVCRA